MFNDVMMSRLGKGLGYGTVPASGSSSVLVSAFLATIPYSSVPVLVRRHSV